MTNHDLRDQAKTHFLFEGDIKYSGYCFQYVAIHSLDTIIYISPTQKTCPLNCKTPKVSCNYSFWLKVQNHFFCTSSRYKNAAPWDQILLIWIPLNRKRYLLYCPHTQYTMMRLWSVNCDGCANAKSRETTHSRPWLRIFHYSEILLGLSSISLTPGTENVPGLWPGSAPLPGVVP